MALFFGFLFGLFRRFGGCLKGFAFLAAANEEADYQEDGAKDDERDRENEDDDPDQAEAMN